MFKAIPYIVKLHMCKTVDYRVNRVAHFCQNNARPQKTTYSQVEERDPCKKPDPCPPPPKDDKAFWGALAILFTVGCFGVYAKHTPEVRDWLTINAAWFDDLIAIAYEENKTHAEHAADLMAAIQSYLNAPEPPRLCDSEGKPIKQPPKKKEKTAVEIVCPEDPDGEPEAKKCQKPEIGPTMKSICDIEKCLLNAGEECINNYWTAQQACKYYNELVEDSLMNFTYYKLKQLRPAMLERLELVKEHACAADRYRTTIDELARILDCGVSAPKDAIDNTYAMLKEFRARIKVIQTEFIWESDRSVSLDERWRIVEKFLDQYVFENETMLPGTKYESKKPSLNGDGDILLHHTLRYRNMLEDLLKAGSQAASERAQRGIESLSQDEKDLKAREQLIQAEYIKKKGELDQMYKKRLDWQKTESDKALQKATKKLKERHERNMVVMVKEREAEATIRLNKMVKDAVEAQKKQFARELADMSRKVMAVEMNLEGDGDKLVLTVLKAIPEQVRKEGVVPESVLRERYHQMEKTARSVALVELEGGPMPVYILSWIQSLLLFMRLSGIPQKDIDKPFKEPKELEDMDTFDRLHLARYWMEQGSLAAAVRYVDSLEGASRAAADSWYRDAKSHLEIRQAAEAVIAHATALSLQYI